MSVQVIEVKAVSDHLLRIRFDDGAEGVVDIAALIPFKGVFAPLADAAFFGRAYVDPDWGTLCWPGDLDLAPEPLWEYVTGRGVTGHAA